MLIRIIQLSCLILGGFYLSGTCQASELKNPSLAIQEGKISGWRASQTMSAVTNDLPDGISHGVQTTVNAEKGNDGQVIQSFSTKGLKGLYRLSMLVKSSKGRTAYLQVKRYQKKKELDRTSSGYAEKSWTRLSALVTIEGADRLGVIARWHHKKNTKGAVVQFADVRIEPIEGVVAFVGDSTVQDYPEHSDRRGWGQMFNTLLTEKYMSVNFAKGGRSTKTFREEGSWKKVLSAKPSLIFIQFGHNDSHEPGRPESTDASTNYAEYLRKYIAEGQSIGSKIILVSPPHRRIFRSNGSLSKGLKPYRDAMHGVAKELNVPFVDLYTQTGELFTKLGEKGTADLFCSVKDRSHFSPKGASLLADMVAKSLGTFGKEFSDIIQ